jgi:hypothetical protein
VKVAETGRGRVPTVALPEAGRFVALWSRTVADFDSLGVDTPDARRALVALNMALPASLRWSWRDLAAVVGSDERTLRRDRDRAEVVALAAHGRALVLSAAVLAALHVGMARVARCAARGDTEAVEALSRAISALGGATDAAPGIPPATMRGVGRMGADADEALTALLGELGTAEG